MELWEAEVKAFLHLFNISSFLLSHLIDAVLLTEF